MTTGEKIKELRKQYGMTQDDLGRAVGLQKAAINKYETGIVVNLKQSTLLAIAKVFRVSPSYLLDDDTDPAEQSLISSYRSLSPRGQQLLLDRAEELRLLYGKKSEDRSAKSV
jgi:transcriptional regulator with XRE-family HTH domain